MARREGGPVSNTGVGVTALAMGIFIVGVEVDRGIPEYEALAEARGRVVWVERHKYGLHFRLGDHPRAYNYAKKGGGRRRVQEALESAGDSVVGVRYDPGDPNQGLFSEKKYFRVFEVSVDGRPVRDYASVVRGWRFDNGFAPWLGSAMIAAGLYLTVKGIRQYRARERPVATGTPASNSATDIGLRPST